MGWNPWDARDRAFIVVVSHPDGFVTRYGHLIPKRKVRAGQVVRKANTNVVKADLVWDGRDAAGTRAPPGEYMVRCTAFDIASRIATAQTPLRVCPADDPTCSGPVKRTPVDGDADVGVAGECVDTGCGCQARGRQPVSWGSLAFLLLALALVWTRRRGEGAAG